MAWNRDRATLLLGMGGGEPAPAEARGGVLLIDTRTWELQARVLPGGTVESLTPSPDRRLLVVTRVDGAIVLADAATYLVLRELRAAGEVRSVAFSPDGTRFAAVGGSKRLELWNVRSGRPAFARPPFLSGAGTAVRWRDNGHEIVYGGEDGSAQLYDVDRAARRRVPLPIYRDAGPGVHVVDGREDRRPRARLPARLRPREGMNYPSTRMRGSPARAPSPTAISPRPSGPRTSPTALTGQPVPAAGRRDRSRSRRPSPHLRSS